MAMIRFIVIAAVLYVKHSNLAICLQGKAPPQILTAFVCRTKLSSFWSIEMQHNCLFS